MVYPAFFQVRISVFLILEGQLVFVDLPRNIPGLVDLYSVLCGRDSHGSSHVQHYNIVPPQSPGLTVIQIALTAL